MKSTYKAKKAATLELFQQYVDLKLEQSSDNLACLTKIKEKYLPNLQITEEQRARLDQDILGRLTEKVNIEDK
jgi:hypothetical protein